MAHSFDADAAVIGAGAVGLACAAALARAGRSVLTLEAAARIGTGASSRSSEVIHAGLYYPTGSLKHRLCVEGRRRLYPYLAARGVAHRRCGKLIVAGAAADVARIEAIWRQGLANGVEDLELLDGDEARRLEPNLACVAALHSPHTGIFDSAGYMRALLGEIEAGGGAVALGAPVERITPLSGGGFEIAVGGAAAMRLRVGAAVNAAGLSAPAVARAIEGLDPAHVPRQRLAKGSYFSVSGRAAFSRLIYPAPVDGGLGVHLTLDLGGRMRFGPDVEWLATEEPEAIDLRVDPARAAAFAAAIRRYWPDLPAEALTPDYAGCRPKLSGPGEPAADFRIDGPERHGLCGLVNLFGIESPGLTSALAIAEAAAARLQGSAAAA